MAEAELNLYQKLAKIREMCEVLRKNKSGYGYKYVSIDEILARVTAGMKKYGVSLIPLSCDDFEVERHNFVKTKVMKNGETIESKETEMVVSGPVIFRWINDAKPSQFIDVRWFATGSQADPSQAFGSAMTYALRYFLLQYFQIATPEDDPDSWRSKQAEAAEAENKAIAAGIIDKVLTIINGYLETHQDERDKVVGVVKKYAKERGKASGNPKAITDPEVAAKLLSEIQEKFGAVQGNEETGEEVK